MKRLFALLVFCLLGTSLATAQTAVVRHNVNLRSDASTDSDIIERLKPGAQGPSAMTVPMILLGN